MSFDNDVELRKVAAVYPEAQLLLRVVCEDCLPSPGLDTQLPFLYHCNHCAMLVPCIQPFLGVGGEDSTATCPMSLKFGAKSSNWRELLRMIQELKLNLAGVQQPKTSWCFERPNVPTQHDLTGFEMIQHDSA